MTVAKLLRFLSRDKKVIYVRWDVDFGTPLRRDDLIQALLQIPENINVSISEEGELLYADWAEAPTAEDLISYQNDIEGQIANLEKRLAELKETDPLIEQPKAEASSE